MSLLNVIQVSGGVITYNRGHGSHEQKIDCRANRNDPSKMGKLVSEVCRLRGIALRSFELLRDPATGKKHLSIVTEDGNELIGEVPAHLASAEDCDDLVSATLAAMVAKAEQKAMAVH